ncbi:hypothetical protein BJV74DRAFT_794609 [Russula compacta]|nr:hypothetical protein BJV74DRAFT_794609 [Russula compacta]
MSPPNKAASPTPTRASTAPAKSGRSELMTEAAAAPPRPSSSSSPSPAEPQPEFKVYKPPEISAPPGNALTSSFNSDPEELPDDYFTPTIADLKARQQQLHARATTLNNAPLLTRAQRDERAKMKSDRWPNTTIRVRFPDRTQLEKTFPSDDKIRSVYALVRDSLREDVKPVKFILSSNPPLHELKVSDPAVRDLTLAQLGLAPSSVLHLRFVDDALNRSDLPAPLASAVLEHAVDLPAAPGFDGNQKTKEAPSSAVSASSSSNTARDSTGGEVKIPKWLKLGAKK